MNDIRKLTEKGFEIAMEKAKVEPQKAERLKNIFLKDEVIKATLEKYVTLLHTYHGYDYEADTIKIMDAELTNLFSKKGENLPAKTEFLIEYTDSTGVYAEIQQVTTADKEAIKTLMKDAGKTLELDKKLKKSIVELEMNLYQKFNFEIHVPSGITTYAFSKREIETKEKNKTDVSTNLEYIEIKIE
jgi:hypothetical protein